MFLGDTDIRWIQYGFVTTLQLKHAGIILAGGASSRMGSPKALLKLPGGRTLAEYQADMLKQAGIQTLCLVLGHQGPSSALQFSSNHFQIVQNPAWESGRLSSLQAGLKVARADGYLILPVDSVGARASTISEMLVLGESRRASAVRPCARGRPGRILWINRTLAGLLGSIPATTDFRLDDWIRDREFLMETDDEGVLNNINTPEEWQRLQRRLP